MTRNFVAVGALALALTACSGGSETPSPDAEETQASSPEPTVEATETPDTETGTPTPTPSVAANEIPELYLGKWDATTGTCSPESDGRMEISSKEIIFYESVGKVTELEEANGGVKVSLAMEGEGETWTEEYLLELNGDQLETSTEGTETFARKKCS